jgi:hypothetical protein
MGRLVCGKCLQLRFVPKLDVAAVVPLDRHILRTDDNGGITRRRRQGTSLLRLCIHRKDAFIVIISRVLYGDDSLTILKVMQ